MITASEARELAGPTIEEKVEKELQNVYKEIRNAAENKKRKINLYDDFWTMGGYHGTEAYNSAVKKLEELGFTVRFHYEALQFVDMYTVVEW
jgi:hypothetical protein